MARALFEKTGRAIYISHLDLMRLFQRAFQRAGLKLTHSQGYNPRPEVSIALPMSLGMESQCELLDFDLEGEPISCEEICCALNECLTDGVRVREVYENGRKLKHLALMRCELTLEYDEGIPDGSSEEIKALFERESVMVAKKGKNGIVEQNIIPMIRRVELHRKDDRELVVSGLICCQNPTLNPMQMGTAIERYLPGLKPDFIRCRRMEIFDADETVFR